MRTTVTIDPDTEALIREEIRRTGASFKEVLNEGLRRGLVTRRPKPVRVETLFTKPFPRELDGVNFNHLGELLDDAETLRELAE